MYGEGSTFTFSFKLAISDEEVCATQFEGPQYMINSTDFYYAWKVPDEDREVTYWVPGNPMLQHQNRVYLIHDN